MDFEENVRGQISLLSQNLPGMAEEDVKNNSG
jgi:hypothetical protein